jgi:peptide/nickel transport system ATP-binding protein
MTDVGTAACVTQQEALLELDGIVAEFPARGGGTVHAVSDVSLALKPGETLGLVGESGCGKSTLARVVVQLVRPVRGSVTFEGVDLTKVARSDLRQVRRRLQMVFQDPIASLNPWRRIRETVAEPLAVAGVGKDERLQRASEMLGIVGLDPQLMGDRRPAELSGGECQRVSIARALVLEPKLLVCDEPVSALDVSLQATMLNLLEGMKARYGLTMLFISHDLAVVKLMADRVAVMYLGKICEIASSDRLFGSYMHPYTALLMAAMPHLDSGKVVNEALQQAGDLPSPVSPPSGCRFRTRCPRAQDVCAVEEPQLVELFPGHGVACHFPITDQLARAEVAGLP